MHLIYDTSREGADCVRQLLACNPLRAVALDKTDFARRTDTLVILTGPHAGYYYAPGDDRHDQCEVAPTFKDHNRFRALLKAAVESKTAMSVSAWPSNW